MKAFDESYSKIIRGHKYKDEDNGKDNDKDKYTDKVPEKNQHPDDLLILNMMKDTSSWSSCSRRSLWSPWSLCSVHTIKSTGPSESPCRDFLNDIKS